MNREQREEEIKGDRRTICQLNFYFQNYDHGKNKKEIWIEKSTWEKKEVGFFSSARERERIWKQELGEEEEGSFNYYRMEEEEEGVGVVLASVIFSNFFYFCWHFSDFC